MTILDFGCGAGILLSVLNGKYKIGVDVNNSALEKAKKRQADAQKERDKLRDVTREVNEIKCEMHDIKNMLTQLLDK